VVALVLLLALARLGSHVGVGLAAVTWVLDGLCLAILAYLALRWWRARRPSRPGGGGPA
jgi:hypothetical protein